MLIFAPANHSTSSLLPHHSAMPAHALYAYCHSKGISLSPRVYFVDAMGAMALGLFASLLVGTILQVAGQQLGIDLLVQIASYAKEASGAAIGLAIASALGGASGLLLLSSATVGVAGMKLGGPVGAYIATLVAIEIGKLVHRTTKVDILVTPLVVIITGGIVAIWLGVPIGYVMTSLGEIVQSATVMQPFWMGIAVSVMVGILLTLPISSAAICIAIGLGGLAGGAATAGCCAQMIGFAVMSYPDNKLSGLVAQGLGTSMLQMPNIIRKPLVWLPPIIASAMTGPVATCIFALENIPIASGMGTCGLVGPLGTLSSMPAGGEQVWLGLLITYIALPALLCWGMGGLMRRMGWLQAGDLKLTY